MKAYVFTYIILFVACSFGFSQNVSIGNWDTLYSNPANDLLLQIRITQLKDSCGNGMTPTHKFEYQIAPGFRKHNFYITWKMTYFDCEGRLYCQERSINIAAIEGSTHPIESTDFLFASSKIVNPHYDARVSYSLEQSNTLLEIPESLDPSSIEGNKFIFLGQSTTLSVNGGVLGEGAEWIWYKEQCGNSKIGKGDSVTVEPTDTTIYFVRAEGKNNITQCAQATVYVDKRSTKPTGIKADVKVCKNDKTILRVEGGSLGLGANWVWYANDCDGKSIGTGKSITVNSTETTTYFVRAEGSLNMTDCAFLRIKVYEKSIDPTSVFSIGSTTICEGESIKLKVVGGLLSDGSEWKWYKGSCDGISVASGLSAEFSPQISTTYFVRAEGTCNNTNCVSIGITVNEKSDNPVSITKPNEIYRHKKITLTVNGGALGKDAQWLWYKGSCSTGNLIGTGRSMVVRTGNPKSYFVKAKGLCNETSCAEVFIDPRKRHIWDYTYSSRYKKFLHIGLGLGFEWLQFPSIAQHSVSSNGNSSTISLVNILINGLGLKGEIPFYPFMKDYLSLGFISAYSIGFWPSFLSSNSADTLFKRKEEHFDYKKFQLESELAFGFKSVKFLFKLKRSFQSNHYQKTLTTNSSYLSKYSFNQDTDKEILSAGIRFGSYTRKYRNERGNNFDLVYTLRRNYPDDLTSFSINDYDYLSEWNVGAGISFWRQSALKIQVDVTLNTLQRDFDFNSVNFYRATYLVSLIYNRNWFY